jgi:hypothetical protein
MRELKQLASGIPARYSKYKLSEDCNGGKPFSRPFER